MLNNVLSRCILWIMGCLLLKETFRNIQKRMDGKWASFFRILAAVMTLLVITGPFGILIKASTTVASETQYLIVDVQLAENNSGLELVVVNDEGTEANITLRTPGIQHSSDGHDYLMIREYMLGEKKYAIEYSPQSQFAKLFKTYQFQNEIRSSL